MLTSDLVRPRLRRRGAALSVETLDTDDATYQQTAAELIALLRRHVGKTRYSWDTALEGYEGERTDYIVIRGLAKVLEDAATFAPIETPVLPVLVREQLFARGPVFSKTDLFHQQTRDDVVCAVADSLGLTAAQVEAALFADRPAEHLLIDPGPDWVPVDLLARYNVELTRGVLYWASTMHVEIHDTYKDFWRYLKLFKLMFEAHPLPDGFQVHLDGPISPFVQSTIRYGRQFAAFLPALFLCNRWRMVAEIRASFAEQPIFFRLDHTSPLRSHFQRSRLFDSRLESDFAAEFETKFGGERGKWRLSREEDVLLLGDSVMLPDFTLTHKRDGRRALVEIVGFWHPDYLRRKVEKVRAAQRRNLILLVYEGVNLGKERLGDVPGEVLYFPNKPILKEVMAAVERCAE